MKVAEKVSEKELGLRLAMRKLWEDHIIWTRVVIISMAADLPDFKVAVGRLMENQVDIGNAIKPFYGDAAGEKLTALLKEHISGAADVVVAARAGDRVKLMASQKAWYANASDISAFLSGANPKYWPLNDMKAMMKDHLDLTTEEAVARLKGEWEKDVAAYDRVHDEILSMADMLSDGLVGQFPDRF